MVGVVPSICLLDRGREHRRASLALQRGRLPTLPFPSCHLHIQVSVKSVLGPFSWEMKQVHAQRLDDHLPTPGQGAVPSELLRAPGHRAKNSHAPGAGARSAAGLGPARLPSPTTELRPARSQSALYSPPQGRNDPNDPKWVCQMRPVTGTSSTGLRTSPRQCARAHPGPIRRSWVQHPGPEGLHQKKPPEPAPQDLSGC